MFLNCTVKALLQTIIHRSVYIFEKTELHASNSNETKLTLHHVHLHVCCCSSSKSIGVLQFSANREARRSSTVSSSTLRDARERNQTCWAIDSFFPKSHLVVRFRQGLSHIQRRRICQHCSSKVFSYQEVQFLPKKSQSGKSVFRKNSIPSWSIHHLIVVFVSPTSVWLCQSSTGTWNRHVCPSFFS